MAVLQGTFYEEISGTYPAGRERKLCGEVIHDLAGPDISSARRRAEEMSAKCGNRFPKAIAILEEGLEGSLSFYAFPKLDSRKIASTQYNLRLKMF